MASTSPPEIEPSISLADRYRDIRDFTNKIAAPLSAEDCMLQSMPDASPTRWHMAHTTWFYETFILKPHTDYADFDEQFNFLFNSYYNTIGQQFPRPQRGMISRPGLARTKQYRSHVDEQMLAFLAQDEIDPDLRYAIEVGLNHEQQHQELMLTDIKHALSGNPTLPIYLVSPFAKTENPAIDWFQFDEGIYEVGHDNPGFSFDNESPRHKTFLHDYSLASHPVTCGQFIEFIRDGGYTTPQHWLSLGWTAVQENGWDAPLYWVEQNDQWMVYTLAGLVPVNPDWPVCHVSHFEADAFARWSGHRLPTEFEWEIASDHCQGNQFADQLFADGNAIHPTGGKNQTDRPSQMLGGVWEWTSNSYAAYPGYAPPAGALGEYNGKFMCNQYVLRGGSVATSRDHIRPTYRNFFPPEARWQFSGFRLAK